MSEYINYNGNFFKPNENVLKVQNRAFRYGDGLFETMFATGSRVPLFYEHISRLINSMNILKMEVPVKFSVDTTGFHHEISRLIIKNKFFMSARVRLSVFREDGGLYSPTNNEVGYVIELEPIKNTSFEIHNTGLKIDIYNEIKKPINILSNLKTSNSLIFVLAGIYKTKKNMDDVIIINQNNYVCESISSNIFIVKNDILYTPAISEGCINGIMRNAVINVAKENNIEVIDDCLLTIDNLLHADEIFLTNAVHGIRWVAAFQNRRYFNKNSKYLTFLVNNKLFNK